jgi:hypothetical protein
MAIGAQPIGVLTVGFLAEHLGPSTGVMVSGGIGVAVTLGCALIWPEMRKRRVIR